METKFSKSTDKEHKVKLESSILYAVWSSNAIHAGGEAGIEVRTLFVGEGCKIKITGKSEKGKKLGKISDTIYGNGYSGTLTIPDKIEIGDKAYFEVKLPQLGLSAESNRIPINPRIVVSNMAWEKKEVGRGDVLKLTADVEGVRDESGVKVIIYEYDPDGNRDKIAEIPANVKNKKIEVLWEFDYHDSTLDILTEKELQRYDKEKHYAFPEYFFTLKIGDEEFGKKQESGLLVFKDWIEFTLLDERGEPYKNEDYIILLADGNNRKGTLDENGHGSEKELPPGEVTIVLPKKGRIFGR
ncbi:MAG: hypothetical protein JSW64_15915 [Candidatus Zixiibacteriota bacterium]|nr:MAG: hypothetical protein JSW64_15915 [candidate division Zixibacteria bacterium]